MVRLFSIRGFTFVELLVVMAVIGIIATISTATFRAMYQKATLESGTSEVFDALTDARAKTLASQGSSVYGVHFSSTTVTRFVGDTYTSGASTNSVYTFESSILATSSIISAGGNVLFSRLTGISNATGTIYVYDSSGAGTTTVIIHGSGLIEYE